MDHPQEQYMLAAIEVAKSAITKGQHAVGAVIVKDGSIIAEAHTTIRSDSDPTAHAEVNAIRIAAKQIGYKLTGCYLYTTYEPCPMCTSAAIWSRMSGIVYGGSSKDQNETFIWRIEIAAREVIEKGTPTLELYEQYMRSECLTLFKHSLKSDTYYENN